ncbi:Serine/threonine-protein kinase nrc-2 [Porphyridium purpureum]|uniref:non-specific serine/threonine protein kinase n=1 Tax=Porphyridium purpureum TaxID=35688 RepID=A0A5J4YL09_PORPP|nr:Serine/threonine-protein kinase nrc-2 [Porphyridium purpureum]|eukprot:POR8462..scf249_10
METSGDEVSTPARSAGPSMSESRASLQMAALPRSDAFPVQGEVGPHLFRKLKLIGRGGVGRVYLVLLKGSEKLYAMKEMTKEEMIQRNKVQRVMTEREIFATANHPFIITMYASFQTKEKLFFVMEYAAGGEFFRVLQKQPQKRMTEDAARFYAAEVTLALEYLHHLGFIYRDLKPENVMMHASGHLSLTDFDLSKQATAVKPRVVKSSESFMDRAKGVFKNKRSSQMGSLEIVNSEPVMQYSTNSFVGTEEYIAPEVVSGTPQTASVDWWTLGILIYEMMCGCTPFKASQQSETFENILTKEVKFPDDVVISKEGKLLIKSLLTREAGKRLGHGGGATDIKNHKWFKDVNFALIRNLDPPIHPQIRDPHDMTQYKVLKDAEDFGGELDEEDPENVFGDFNSRRDVESQQKY